MQLWSDDTKLYLLTPEEYKQLPDGVELTSIMGDKAIKGKDNVDQDTRMGHLAYGVEDPFNHELKNLFSRRIMLVFRVDFAKKTVVVEHVNLSNAFNLPEKSFMDYPSSNIILHLDT